MLVGVGLAAAPENLKACVFIKGELAQFPVQIDREPEQHSLRHDR